jgi:hypothetical protein
VSEKNFKFHVPVELIKSEEEDVWRVRGIASTGDQDLQGETVDQEGLDISALKAGRGLFNWDHQKGPENILGQIEDAEFVEKDGKRCLMVDGYLFKEQERAKAFHNILKSIKKGNAPRVHMSIEGKILDRDKLNMKKIKKARIDKVALTLDPVNPYTFAELVKSLNAPEVEQVENDMESQEELKIELTKSEFDDIITDAVQKALKLHFEQGEYQENPKPKLIKDADQDREVKLTDHKKMANDMESQHKDIQAEITKAEEDDTEKALAAGAGYADAPESRTDGEAMSKESLEKEPKKTTHDKKEKKSKREVIKSVLTSLSKAHPDEDPMDLATWMIETYLESNEKE